MIKFVKYDSKDYSLLHGMKIFPCVSVTSEWATWWSIVNEKINRAIERRKELWLLILILKRLENFFFRTLLADFPNTNPFYFLLRTIYCLKIVWFFLKIKITQTFLGRVLAMFW